MTNDRPEDALGVTLRQFSAGERVFGRFTLRKILGRGAMGIVWLGRDEELEREVALKFLPDLVVLDKALVSELKRETRRSLELTHKNIVRIYDFVQGENSACISMEYIDGDTLSNLRAEKERKVFQPKELAGWTAQLCDALDYAHNHARIIHRDLKPANLMVNQRGDLKVSDFGIARSLGDSMSKLTMASGTSGTLVYMSPQQLDGERGTHLDDIYSLGATLYDLLTSKPPFYSGNLDKQIHERVAPSMTERRKDLNIEPASVPAIWEEVVAACLRKDPGQRPQSTREIAARLQLDGPERIWTAPITRPGKKRVLAVVGIATLLALGAGIYFQAARRQSAPLAAPAPQVAVQPAAMPKKSVAVLPFENLSTDEQNAVFAGGVHREVLSNLAKVADLKVISRSSVMRYKPGTDRNLKEIAAELGVAYVVEGSVQREAGQVRVTAELVDTSTDAQLWGETYDGAVADVLRIQGEIAQRISNQLGAKLSPRESSELATKPTQDLAAFENYIRARSLMEGVEGIDENFKENHERALQLLEQAVARDPQFAAGYWALAEANIQLFRNSGMDVTEYRDRAEAALKEAQRLAPAAGETIYAEARVVYYGYRDYKGALATLERAARLLPNNAEVSVTRALLYRRFGRWQEAYAQFVRATELNPQDPFPYYNAAAAASFLRWWDDADRIRERAIKRFPRMATEPRARLENAFMLLVRGEVEAGNRELDSLNPTVQTAFLPLFYRAFCDRNYAEARRVVNEAAKDPDLQVARWGGEVSLAVVANLPPDPETTLAMEKQLEERVGNLSKKDEADVIEMLACVKMILGKKEEAIRLREEYVAKHPVSEDAVDNVAALRELAVAYAMAGEDERALETLAKLVQMPLGMEYGPLKHDPTLERLRKDPRFDEILKQSQKPFPRL